MDTIAAIATAMGEGGIGIIRLSGPEAISAVDKIFYSKKRKKLSELPSHQIFYGHIKNSSGEIVDEVLVSLMKAPHTYTREDIVEINCHGGLQPLKQTLGLVLQQDNVRLAEAGEFTKRAFLNGRIDLVQAESVIDVIRSQTDSALRVSVGQLQGRLSQKVNAIRQKLINIQAAIAVNVDYPEYDEPERTRLVLRDDIIAIINKISDLLASSSTGRIMREGLKTVIVGKPNVGKSSLLNMLLGEERAIVTAIPGTTRDTVEEYLSLGGIPLRIVDTAGIRESDDPVERIGVERSRKALSAADLVLLVLDISDQLSDEDKRLLKEIPQDRSIIILNKTDLKPEFSTQDLLKYQIPIVTLSALQGTGLASLEERVKGMFMSGKIDSSSDVIVSNIRHINLLKEAKLDLEQALEAIDNLMPIDLVNIDIENASQNLGKIIGRTVEEDLLDHVFSKFCVGK